MFDYDVHIRRNELKAKSRYGNLIDKNRRVSGTDIWFDEKWRFHNDKYKFDVNTDKEG